MADDDDEWRFSVEDVGVDESDTAEDAPSGVTDGAADEAGEGNEWAVTIGEDDDGPTVVVGDADADAEGDENGNVAGSLMPRTPVERGTPNLENAAFVTAGVLLTVLVLGSLFQPEPVVLGGVGVAVLGTAGALYLFFTRV